MPKPSTPVDWATDAAYTADADPWASAANKVDPGATRRAEGAEPDTFPAEWYNYMQNSLGEHVEYIEGVLEATDSPPSVTRTLYVSPALCEGGSFLSSTRNYVAAVFEHTNMAASEVNVKNITESIPPGAVITDVIFVVSPSSANTMTLRLQRLQPNFGTGAPGSWVIVDGDVSVGAGDQIVTLSGLTERWDPAYTLYQLICIASSNPGDDITSVQIRYTHNSSPVNEGLTFDATKGDRRALYKRDLEASNEVRSVIALPLSRVLPHGATLTQVRALVQPGAARATALDRMDLGLYRNTGRDFDTPALGATALIGSETTDDGTTGLQTLDLTGLTEIMDSTDALTAVVRSSSVTDMIEDEFFGFEIQFTDPGPRNF